jgi:hypothetical protein
VPIVYHKPVSIDALPPINQKGRTHILRTSSLQVHRPGKQLLQHREHSLPLQTPLQTPQQLQIHLDLPPLAPFNPPLHQRAQPPQQHLHHLGLHRIREQHYRRRKRRLERLLDRQLQDEVDKVSAQQLVVPVVGKQRRDGLNLLVPGPHGVLGDGDALFAHAHVRGRVEAALVAGGAAAVEVIIFFLGGEG